MGSSCPGYVPPVETASHRTENEGKGQRAKCVRKTTSNVQHQCMRNKAMKVILRLKDLHAYGKICESVHKTASANKICKRKRSFAKV